MTEPHSSRGTWFQRAYKINLSQKWECSFEIASWKTEQNILKWEVRAAALHSGCLSDTKQFTVTKATTHVSAAGGGVINTPARRSHSGSMGTTLYRVRLLYGLVRRSSCCPLPDKVPYSRRNSPNEIEMSSPHHPAHSQSTVRKQENIRKKIKSIADTVIVSGS